MPTQFVLRRNVTGRDGTPDLMTARQICLKLNSKLGGTNQTLHQSALSIFPGDRMIFREPTIVLGADVTHPSPEDLGEKPSIAALVASVDPIASRYECEVRYVLFLIFGVAKMQGVLLRTWH
jgi:eukaryotic translation initiation factor 2C